MMDTKILAFRTKKGITQKQLADLVGTSQQQIHRIETGKQSVRFDLAIRICSALSEPMESVFPDTKRSLEKLGKKYGKSLEKNLHDAEFGEEMARAAVDMDPREWTFKYRLRGGATGCLPISGTEKDRLFGAVQRCETDSFVVFDSGESTIILNMDHLIFCHFLFEGPNTIYPEQEQIKEDSAVKVFLADSSEPMSFDVEADEHDEDDSEEMGQFGNLIFTAEHSAGEDNVVFHFEDSDGEDVFLRGNDTAMIQIPLWVVEPDLLELEYEQTKESTGNA
ncbi:MAG: helix-turn-helix transcriptional regulator [Nitrospira sp.]|nr:helix-turn-helix transcriptional regulator [Nitrospira sp.]